MMRGTIPAAVALPKVLGRSSLLAVLALLSVSFLGSSCQSAYDYVCETAIRPEMSRNKDNLAKLRIGMSKEDVKGTMGEALDKEVYNTPEVWYYYEKPRWQDGAATRDECTPLVFDEDGRLAGWGKEYYKTHYEFNTWPFLKAETVSK